MCNDRGGGLRIRSTAATIGGLGWGVGIVSHDVRMVCRAANVAVASQDFFGGDFGGVCKELIILQDGLEIFRDLVKRLEQGLSGDSEWQYSPRTSRR